MDNHLSSDEQYTSLYKLLEFLTNNLSAPYLIDEFIMHESIENDETFTLHISLKLDRFRNMY